MRKGFLVGLALFLIFPVFSLDMPLELEGIWEGKDRFVFFEQYPDDKNPELVVLLKEYYGWYIDRTAEPAEYNEKVQRAVNSGTTKKAENIAISFEEIYKTQDCWTGFVCLQFSKSQSNKIPVCKINNQLYLDFLVQDSENPQFYRGVAVSEGIKIAQQKIPENIAGFIIDEENLFNIRYWKTDMDFSSENATFTYNGKSYTVPRHIKCGNTLYSCVSGRSKKVRNIQPPQKIKKDDFIWSLDNSVLVLDKEPYLYQLAEHKTFEDLMQIVKEQNSKRKPDPPPLFPPDDLNWHWDLIDLLEKDNVLIQEVRKRQKEFGPRPKDLNK